MDGAAAGGGAATVPVDGAAGGSAATDAAASGGVVTVAGGGGATGCGFAVGSTADSDLAIVLDCSLATGAGVVFCGGVAIVGTGRAARRASDGGGPSRGTRVTGKAATKLLVGATAGGVVSGAFAVFCSGAAAGVTASATGAATFLPGIGVVDSLERVPYQMPTASTSAVAPTANGIAGIRRVPRPMTTGAIDAAACTAGSGRRRGAAPAPAPATR